MAECPLSHLEATMLERALAALNPAPASKGPHMFGAAEVLLPRKTDLLPHIRFDADRAVANALAVNPRLHVFRLSAYTGEGLSLWYDWLRSELAACQNPGSVTSPPR